MYLSPPCMFLFYLFPQYGIKIISDQPDTATRKVPELEEIDHGIILRFPSDETLWESTEHLFTKEPRTPWQKDLQHWTEEETTRSSPCSTLASPSANIAFHKINKGLGFYRTLMGFQAASQLFAER